MLVLCQRYITWPGVKNKKIELITQGELSLFVKDGIIQLPALQKARITRAQLYTILRTKNIYQLGQVKRVYPEASGSFSIYLEKGAGRNY